MRTLKALAALALAAVLLLAAPAPAAASAYCDWSGVWATTRGEMTLVRAQDGGYTGTYGQTGRLELKAADPWAWVVRGTWRDGAASGPCEFRMDDDMKGFGGWRNSPGNVWRGTRDTVPAPVD
jgi:hypothetical protein